ncbi:MAG: carbohydrate-binding protein [Verrucomicrobiota bacterium]
MGTPVVTSPDASAYLPPRPGFKIILPLLTFITLSLPPISNAQTSGLLSPQPISPYLNGNFPATTSVSGGWEVIEAFPNLSFYDPVGFVPVPNSNDIFVVAKPGLIYRFPNNPNATQNQVTTVLDIRSKVRLGGDSGLHSIVFHPDFGQPASPNRRYCYVYYRYTPDQSNTNGDATRGYMRLSRFTIQDGQPNLDPNSEQILIQQYDRHDWHQGGGMFFGPDGFLYLTVGDEGGARDIYDSGQKINAGLLAGVLRIDVDKDPTRSHPIRRQPQNPANPPFGWPDSFSANYYIPNDNPWVDPSGNTLEEFYAIGLRSPHTMSQDPLTGDVFIGDVGQNDREEVNFLSKGANFQWPYREGSIGGFKSKPNPLIGTDSPPIWDYNRNTGNCVIVGVVYRGAKWDADLGGKLLVGDYGTRNIWALSYTPGETADVELLAQMPPTINPKGQLAFFGVDHDGEVYMCKPNGTDNANGKIYKLNRPGIANPQPPSLLSQTGAFTNLSTLETTPGLIPYDVNSPLWSDGAFKKRWVSIPNNGTHNTSSERISYSENENWSLPIGSVTVKHFEIPLDERNPDGPRRRLETRFMIRDANGEWYGLTYKWRANNSDADLVDPLGLEEEFTITNENGQSESIKWLFPSRGACLSCHTSQSGRVLGLRTRQLNRNHFYESTNRTANQLATLNALGILHPPLNTNDLDNLLTSAPLGDPETSIQKQALSYLDSNCSHCHQPGTNVNSRANFDARLSTPPFNQAVVNGDVFDTLGISDPKVVKPQNTNDSVLYQRVNTIDECCAMPPLGKNRINNEATQVLSAWINSLDPNVTPGGGGSDLEEPLPTLTSNAQGNNITAPFTVSVTFPEEVLGLTLADFDVTNGSALNLSGSGSNYSITINPNSPGVVSVFLPSDSVVDNLANANPPSNTLSASYSLADTTPPSVSLATPNNTVTSSFNITANFSENVFGLSASDFTVSNGNATSLSGNGSSYTLTVAPGAEGTVSISLPANRANDPGGNGNTPSNTINVTFEDRNSGGGSGDNGNGGIPFNGNAPVIPARIEAEDFDLGGQGVSYSDNDAQDIGLSFISTPYRTSSVDLEDSFDPTNTPSIGWTQDGEWLHYTVDITPGIYDINVRIASDLGAPADIRLLISGRELGVINTVGTQGWYSWTTLTLANVNISESGLQTLRLEFVNGDDVNLNWIEITSPNGTGGGSGGGTPNGQQPFGNTPAPIPGRIEAENYDTGGQDTAYSDVEPNNIGEAYRADGVDLERSNDSDNGFSVGWIEDTEWLEYTVDVTPGDYDITARFASEFFAPGFLRVILDGQVLGTLNAPGTNNWYAWENRTLQNINISANGNAVLRLEIVGGLYNLNWIEFTSSSGESGGGGGGGGSSGQEPFTGSPSPIPGRIQAEDYDSGGEGVAYQDNEPLNQGQQYRTDGVDIENSGDNENGFSLGWFDSNEWVEYTTSVTPGTYTARVRVASNEGNPGDLRVILGDAELGTFPVESTGGWDQWVTVSLTNIPVALSGEHILRIETIGDGVNFNWIEFVQTAAATESAIANFVFIANGYDPGNGSGSESGNLLVGPAEDGDLDGDNNLFEFGVGSNPASGADPDGIVFDEVTIEGQRYATISTRVLIGGAFDADGSYNVLGMTYRGTASTDLINWIIPVTPTDNPASLPIPPPGYKYITYRTTIPTPNVFLRLHISGDR